MNDWLVFIHRDYSGEHVTDGEACWCNPVLVQDDDARTTEELLKASEPMPS